MKGDFHIHTTYSDGALSVEEVLTQGKNLILSVLPIMIFSKAPLMRSHWDGKNRGSLSASNSPPNS